MEGQTWRPNVLLVPKPNAIIGGLVLLLVSCSLTLTNAIYNDGSHHQTTGQELSLRRIDGLRMRQLQIPGIFDLSAGGMNPNSNTNENEEQKEEEEDITIDNDIIENEITTDVPTVAAGEETTPSAAIGEDNVPTPSTAPVVSTGTIDASNTATTTTTTTTTTTIAPTPIPEIAATYTSSGRNPTTPYPTQLIGLLDLPATVDVEECRKHLRVANADRNNWLNEAEYIEFVHQTVAAATNQQNNGAVVWGTTLETMPPAIQVLYKELNQGGAIEIVGYKTDPSTTPTRIQELFLIQVCVHTEVVVNHILQGNGGTQTAYSVPEDEVVSVYSSFQLSNKVGLTSSNLELGSGANRDSLEMAYRTLITKVVSDKVGQELSGLLEDQEERSSSSSTAKSGRETNRREKGRRQLTVSVDPRLPVIYRVDDTPCPGTNSATAAGIQTEWCQTAYGSFTLFLVGQDQIEVYDEFSQAVQTATSQGQMQTILEQVDPDAEVRVTDAGERILPPPPTHSPTPVPAPAPTTPAVEGGEEGPHNSITVPEEQLTVTKVEEADSKHENMEMILALAGILMTVNCCIISISVYLCWKNRNNADIDLGVYDDDPSINDAYYDNLRANRKSRMSKRSRRKSSDAASIRSMDSAPPTMDDIRDSQTHYPAPSPAPMPFPHDDAQARERILRGQGTSGRSNISSASSSSAAPTREEIEATLKRSATAGSSAAHSVSARSVSARSVRFEDESETEYTESYPANAGEMA